MMTSSMRSVSGPPYLGAEGLAYASPGNDSMPSSLREELDSMSVGLSAGIVSRPGCCCSCTYTQGLKTKEEPGRGGSHLSDACCALG